MGNAVAKSTPMGDVIVKDKRGGPRKIDSAVAAIVAYDRALWHCANTKPGKGRVIVMT